MYKFLLALILLSYGITANSQEIQLTNPYDFSVFEGVWQATEGNKTYELTLVQEKTYVKTLKDYWEMTFGALKYIENGKIIKETKIDGLNSVMFGIMTSPTEVGLTYRDQETNTYGSIDFSLKDHDNKVSDWVLTKRIDEWGTMERLSGRKIGAFDIPIKLEFKKIK